MDGLEEKLGALFSSPESMAQLKQLADTLAGTLGSGGGDRTNGPDRGSDMPDGPDPRLMQLIAGVLREFQAPSLTGELVAALRPWLDEERGKRLEKALRIARLTRAARTALPELGMRK